MKKKYLLFVLIITICVTLFGCGKKEEITLETIAKKFNNCETVKTYKGYGYKINASVNNNELVIVSEIGDTNSTISYTLTDNILSNSQIPNESIMATLILIDSIGQLHGYKDGELADNLNAFPDEISKYTIEKDGFEFKTDNNISSLRIDITKKTPLNDLSKLYLKPSQFDILKKIIEEKSTGNETGKLSKLAYNLEIGTDKNHIYIGEKNKLTDSAYKSVLSALEVMYGKEIANKFESLYPKFKNKKTTVGAFTIETNYKIDTNEEPIFKGMKVVLVTINNKKVK